MKIRGLKIISLVLQEVKELRKKTGAHGDPKELAVALNLAQEQQAQLEQTLSSETKVKMDLFSALGGARRQLQINESEYIGTRGYSSSLKER
jgi:transcriptional regulator with XRE-family HTH domain